MLSKDLQKKVKANKREHAKREQAEKNLEAMEAYLSDKEAYA
jgi:hypothetical protein